MNPVTPSPWNVPGILMEALGGFYGRGSCWGSGAPTLAVGGRPRGAVLPSAELPPPANGTKIVGASGLDQPKSRFYRLNPPSCGTARTGQAKYIPGTLLTLQ